MNFEKVDYKTLKWARKTKLQAMLEEFIAMDTPCVKVNFGANEYKSPSSAAASLYQTAKNLNLNSIKVRIIKGQVYIFNTLLIDEL